MRPLTPSERAVVLVAEGLHRAHLVSKPWWAPRRPIMDFVPAAREAVAILLLLHEGRALSQEILDDSSTAFVSMHDQQEAFSQDIEPLIQMIRQDIAAGLGPDAPGGVEFDGRRLTSLDRRREVTRSQPEPLD